MFILINSIHIFIQERLPGPPQNIRVEEFTAHSVRIIWDPPVKNPDSVEFYRYVILL